MFATVRDIYDWNVLNLLQVLKVPIGGERHDVVSDEIFFTRYGFHLPATDPRQHEVD